MKKKLYRCLGVSVLLLLVCLKVSAQQRLITGTVKDMTGTALPGVSVLIKGTTIGTVSDANGVYSINAAPDDVLSFSFIGFKSMEVQVAQQSTIQITMNEDTQTLD